MHNHHRVYFEHQIEWLLAKRMTKDDDDDNYDYNPPHPHQHHLRVDFEREIEWLRAKRDEVWQRVALLERVAGGRHDDDCDCDVDCSDKVDDIVINGVGS